MRIIVLLAAHNEERFIDLCLEHYCRQGVETYLLDNDSTDGTLEIARQYLGYGLIDIERFPRNGYYSWRPILERKEQLAATLPADWFVHADPDEIRLPPSTSPSLHDALAAVTAAGYNAVNFMEFTFVPTREAPDHDHPDFQATMRWYYPFLPVSPHRLNAWRRQPGPVELAWSGGHLVRFPGLRPYPSGFPMRHYLFLSREHAQRKYLGRRYDPIEVQSGWHGGRASLSQDLIRLPSQAQLRPYRSDRELDGTNPRSTHYLFDETWAT